MFKLFALTLMTLSLGYAQEEVKEEGSLFDLMQVSEEKQTSENDQKIKLMIAPVNSFFAQGNYEKQGKGLLSDTAHPSAYSLGVGKNYFNLGYKETLDRKNSGIATFIDEKTDGLGLQLKAGVNTVLAAGVDSYHIANPLLELSPEGEVIKADPNRTAKRTSFGAAYDKNLNLALSSKNENQKCVYYNASIGIGIGGAAISGLSEDVKDALFVGLTKNSRVAADATIVISEINTPSSALGKAKDIFNKVVDEVQVGADITRRSRLIGIINKEKKASELMPKLSAVYLKLSKNVKNINISYELSNETLNRTFGEAKPSVFHKVNVNKKNVSVGAFRNNKLDLWGGQANIRIPSGTKK